MRTPCDINYLMTHRGQSLGTYKGLDILIVDYEDDFKDSPLVVIAQTAHLVEYNHRSNTYRTIGYVTSNWEVKTYDTPLPYVPKAKEKDVSSEVPVDIAIDNIINETLKGKTLDDLLNGFNYGLE